MADTSLYNRFEQFPRRHETITKSDVTNLPREMLVMAGSDGTLTIVDHWDNAITYTVTAGTIIPIIAKRVNATNSTVSPVIGLY
jgi:hypothetical protein